MKKKLWPVVALLALLLAVVVVALYFEDREYEFVEGRDYPEIMISDHEMTAFIKAWEDKETGLIHYFLPGGIESKSVYRGNVSKDELKFDDMLNYRLKFSSGEVHQIEYKGKIFKAVFHLIPNMSSLFIDTKSQSMEKIHSQKGNAETGSIISFSEDGNIEYFGELKEIKGHGNTTWDVDTEKRSYSIELSETANIGGITGAEDLVLLSLFYEGDKIHSKLGFDLAQIFDAEVSVRSTYISLYLNGEYMGLYLATDPPKKLETFNSKDSEFLIEKDFSLRAKEEDYFETESGSYFCVSRPKFPSDEFLKEISEYIQNVENDVEDGITDLIDTESFAKQFMIQQITHNNDAFRTSVYFYKMRNDNRLYAGPAWDFDGGFGEFIHSGENFVDPEASVFIEDYDQLDWYKYLADNEIFCEDANAILYDNIDEIVTLFTKGIDNYEKLLKEAMDAENARWKWADTKDFYRPGNYKSWDNNVRYLRYFCQERLKQVCRWHNVEMPADFFIGNGEIHTVTFKENGKDVLKLLVNDGARIDMSEYPELQGREWMFTYFNEVFSDYLPILEDCELVPYNPNG